MTLTSIKLLAYFCSLANKRMSGFDGWHETRSALAAISRVRPSVGHTNSIDWLVWWWLNCPFYFKPTCWMLMFNCCFVVNLKPKLLGNASLPWPLTSSISKWHRKLRVQLTSYNMYISIKELSVAFCDGQTDRQSALQNAASYGKGCTINIWNN